MTVTIIADDLTGACDAGAVFCGGGPVAVFLAPGAPGPAWPVAAVDSESRPLAPVDAGRRIRALAGQLAPRLAGGVVLKKIDSTLRGPIGAELDALLSSTSAGAVLCPAFPAQRRVVRDGVLYVGGVPAHESPVGRDPAYPGATSDVLEILGRQSRRPLRRVTLAAVRGGDAGLARALDGADGGIAVADAEIDGDLAALVRAALARGAVLAGSAGLAAALSAALGHAGGPPPLPAGRAWLVVAGSRHPATRAQIAALATVGAAVLTARARAPFDPGAAIAALAAGQPAVVASAEDDDSGREAIAAALASAAVGILAAGTPALVCATGGETAHALISALGASHLELAGAPASGLAVGQLIPPARAVAPRVPLLTKAGGFGPPDLFTRLMRD